jgi:predicted acetyltransferase
MLDIEVLPATQRERPVLARLVELYRHDFSEFDAGDVDDDGHYGYRGLDAYWAEPDRHPFLFRVNGQWAGFALVRSGQPHHMAEFFVMRKYRRGGVGRAAAVHLFSLFPGEWEVRQARTNPAAVAFWRTIPYGYEEVVSGDWVTQRFHSLPAASSKTAALAARADGAHADPAIASN